MALPIKPPARAPTAAPINAPSPPRPFAPPINAPEPAPIKAPLPVLFCVPSGFTQPVNTTAEAANAKVKTCSFIIQNPFNQTTNGIPSFIQNQPQKVGYFKPFSTAASVS